MAEQKALILKDGKVQQLGSGDTLSGVSADDFHSGYNTIQIGQTVTVKEFKQMINFIGLTLDGTLTLDGDLWLA